MTLGMKQMANPKAIKVVPIECGIATLGIGILTGPHVNKTFYSIVAEHSDSVASMRIELVSGFRSEIEAETLAMWIRSAITNNGEIEEPHYQTCPGGDF